MDERASMTEWRLSGGPYDGQVWRAWPGREIRKPVITSGRELGDVVYAATGVKDRAILATYEGFERRECPCEDCQREGERWTAEHS